jgi:hypothetical protein
VLCISKYGWLLDPPALWYHEFALFDALVAMIPLATDDNKRELGLAFRRGALVRAMRARAAAAAAAAAGAGAAPAAAAAL